MSAFGASWGDSWGSSFGGTPSPGVDVTKWGRIRHDARKRRQAEQEDIELLRIVRTYLIPEILRRRRRR